MTQQSPKDYLTPLVQIPEEFHKKNFLILEGREHRSGYYSYSYPDLYVAKSCSHYYKNWSESHAALHQEGFQMLTLRQFVDFLNLLNSGKAFDGKGNKVSSSELETLLKEITEQREPLRAEWLDAQFEKKDNKRYINYEHRMINGKLKPQRSELLLPYFAKITTPCLSLKDYMKRATTQGMPPANVRSGNLRYSSPTDGMVARFWAGADRVDLSCWLNPQSSGAALGVRRVREKK